MQFKVRRRVLYYFLIFFRFILCLFPRWLTLRIGEFLGGLAFLILRKDRLRTVENLKRAFGSEWSIQKIETTALRVFRNIGKTFAEIITMQYRLGKIIKRIKVENFQVVDNVLKEKKGIIVVGGHFGNWELLAAYFALKHKDFGYQGGVIGRRIRYYKYNQLLVNMRESYWIKTFYRDQSMKPVLKLLKKNGIIGVVPDQDVASIKGVFVDFFGKKAYTPAGPAYLSMISGAPLVPACLVWDNDDYILKVGEAIEPDTADREAAVELITARWSGALELFIRQFPDQWVWFHDRWKTREHEIKKI